ncbi:outer membrane beta-barrel protein [Bowmanella pacifica]|uniref:Capsular polysaccharide biosynthesis protein n=1 Tax=Bowmanella pacifica TaxID=502051 RepID=A0A917YSF4_9ALTE|nr:outer membrane beta-barrel protein [Bowmanella pacifica]GGO64753.1 capsular polysaccharide biosynthesis protein [Bowmanella pacifica]
MNKPTYLSLLVAATLSSAVIAQEQAGYVIQTESGFDIMPGFDVKLKHDDNIANTNVDEESSTIAVYSPTIAARLLDGVNEYNLQAGVSKGQYFSSSIDNYLDAYAGADAKWEFSDSHRVFVEASFADGHDQRGTGIFDAGGATQAEPTEHRTLQLNGYFEYGARTTPARIRLGGGFIKKDYHNLESITQYREYDKTNASAAFYYDTGAFTSLVAQVTRDDIRYDKIDPVGGNRDNIDTRYLVGMDWQATALTSGEFRIGYQNKRFDYSGREDFSGISWQAAVNWQPLSYSTVTLETGRKARDPDLRGDVIKESAHGLGWKHDWSEDLQTNLVAGHVRSDYQGYDQKDKYWRYEAKASYRISYLWKLEGGLEISDRTSTDARFEFDKTVFYVGVGINL